MGIKQIDIQFSDQEGYPILVGHNYQEELVNRLSSDQTIGKKIAIITNPNLVDLYALPLKTVLDTKGFQVSIHPIPNGEVHKNLETVHLLCNDLLPLQLERKDSIIALGGGIVGDIAGFVASILLRGISLFQVPTSLLAQVDAAIGGKTGVNHESGKNLIGSFYQPKLVFIDTSVLSTLDKRELKCGLAEIIKYGVIYDHTLFDFIANNKAEILQFDPVAHLSIWTTLIERSAHAKAVIVEKDEKESSIREILNFGHTIGHAIERGFNYDRYYHGEAIAIGMILASQLAYEEKILDKLSYERITELIRYLGFDTSIPEGTHEQVLPHLMTDKKIKSGVIRFILPIKIGETTVYNCPSLERIRNLFTGESS